MSSDTFLTGRYNCAKALYQVYKVYFVNYLLKSFININPLLIVFYTPRCYTYHINYIQSGEGIWKKKYRQMLQKT